MHIANVKRVKLALVEAQKYSEARARAIVAEEVAGYKSSLDHEVRLAFDAGVKKAVIRREGLGTSDSKTLEDILSRTAAAANALAAVLERDPLAHRYSYNVETGKVTVTLAGQEFLAALVEEDWDFTEAAAIRFGLDKFAFEVKCREDGSQYAVAAADRTFPEYNYNTHPVAAWLSKNKLNEAELIEWFTAREN